MKDLRIKYANLMQVAMMLIDTSVVSKDVALDMCKAYARKVW